MADKPSGEVLALILDRVDETARDVKTLTAQHSDTMLSLNDGKHCMARLREDVDGLLGRVGEIEKMRTPQSFPAVVQQQPQPSLVIGADEDSGRVSGSRRKAEPRTESITRGLNVAAMVKLGILAGAVIAGYVAAMKALPGGGP